MKRSDFMSCWGMGISQSDEYCSVYEQFMEDYDKGKPVREITKDIIGGYLEEFSEDDGILHDVFFSLGKAEWMCGGVSETILTRITLIVETEENISFLRELGVTEDDLITRKRNLKKFLQILSVPRDKVKKRKTPEEKYIPELKIKYIPLPTFDNGDVFAYHSNGEYRVFAVVNQKKVYTKEAYRKVAFCYLWKKSFVCVPSTTELIDEHIMPLGYFDGDTFPKSEKIGNISNLKKLGKIRSPELIKKEWNRPVFVLSLPDLPPREYDVDLCLTLKEVLSRVGHL